MEDHEITRRDFVSMTVGAGIVAATAAEASAQQRVVETNVEIKTADGTCDAAFIHPATGSYPAVLIWPDAFGLRPSMRDLAKRLAADGYSVLVPTVMLLSPAHRKLSSRPFGKSPEEANTSIRSWRKTLSVREARKPGAPGFPCASTRSST